jgi:ATP-dependent DNA ligase
MLPTLAKLQQKCQDLGLNVVQSGKRPAKEDYVTALRTHHLPEGGVSYVDVEPMLCFAEWNLKPAEQEHIWTSPNWAAQQKLNGCRAIIHFVKDQGVFAHSRTVSLKTYRMQELTKQLLFHAWTPSFSATIDCELLIEKPIDTRGYSAKGELTKTSLHSTVSALHLEPEASRRLQVAQDAPLMVHAFDILKMFDQDLQTLPLSERLNQLTQFRAAIAGTEIEQFFRFPPVVSSDKRAFFDQVIASGGEGVILKNLRAPYIASSSRSRDAWVKCKRRREHDAFVSGFLRGEPSTGWKNLVGALEFSVHTESGDHVLGYATNLTMENRQKITIYDPETDTVKLHPSLYGKVAEISGQDISARELRLSHCTIDRWRSKTGPDAKRAEDCIESMADLRAAAEWVG